MFVCLAQRRAATACALLSFLVAAGAAASEPTFEQTWQDGKAEIDGYDLTVTRYGEPRGGRAVLVYVTEPFSMRRRVKVDNPSKDPADTFEALKLNLVRDFQTGIYDYNTMTSVFARSRDFAPAKISFSSAEWCGHVYEELRFDRTAVRQTVRSYFEGESGDRELKAPRGGVPEENLYILLRGLRGAYLRPGETRTVPFLPASIVRRLTHRPAAWSSATIERADRAEQVVVPAGTFEAQRYVVKPDDGRVGTFWVEAATPHRLLRWTWSGTARGSRMAGDAAERAELTGTARVPYWQLHRNGDERLLRDLGLEPLPGAGDPGDATRR